MSQPLEHLQWNNRIILLSAPDASDASLETQSGILGNCVPGLEERKLRVFKVLPTGVYSGKSEDSLTDLKASELSDAYDLSTGAFEFVLVGLDGGIKHRSSRPVNCDALFAIIDAMPMRRAEIARKRSYDPD